METTDFWRDLEARFRALHEEQLQERGQGSLAALWDGNEWHLSDGTAHVSTNFERLAKSAAVRLGHPGEPTAVSFWLDLLKAESGEYLPFEPTGGRIELVSKVSADYCLECDTQEIIRKRVDTPAKFGAGKWSRSRRIPRTLLQFWVRNWKWIITTLLSALGLYFAYKKLG